MILICFFFHNSSNRFRAETARIRAVRARKGMHLRARPGFSANFAHSHRSGIKGASFTLLAYFSPSLYCSLHVGLSRQQLCASAASHVSRTSARERTHPVWYVSILTFFILLISHSFQLSAASSSLTRSMRMTRMPSQCTFSHSLSPFLSFVVE